MEPRRSLMGCLDAKEGFVRAGFEVGARDEVGVYG